MLSSRQGAEDTKLHEKAILDSWGDMPGDVPLYVHAYYNFPAYRASIAGYFPFPGFTPGGVIDFMSILRENNVRGLFGERQSHTVMRAKSLDWLKVYKNARSYRAEDPWNFHSYPLDQLELYLTYKLADNPTLDGQMTIVEHGNALLGEFFTRYYGRAADSMRAFYDEVETAYTREGASRADEKAEDAAYHNQVWPTGRLCCNTPESECNACIISECGPEPTIECENECFDRHRANVEFLCVFNEMRGQLEWHDWRQLGTQVRMEYLEAHLNAALAVAVEDLVKKRLELFVRGVWCRMVYEYNFNADRYGNVPLELPALCE